MRIHYGALRMACRGQCATVESYPNVHNPEQHMIRTRVITRALGDSPELRNGFTPPTTRVDHLCLAVTIQVKVTPIKPMTYPRI